MNNSIKTVQEVLNLPQEQKDAMLLMGIELLASSHKIFPSDMNLIDRMTPANFSHHIAQIKQSLTSHDDLIRDFEAKSGIELNELSSEDEFIIAYNMMDKAFKKEE